MIWREPSPVHNRWPSRPFTRLGTAQCGCLGDRRPEQRLRDSPTAPTRRNPERQDLALIAEIAKRAGWKLADGDFELGAQHFTGPGLVVMLAARFILRSPFFGIKRESAAR